MTESPVFNLVLTLEELVAVYLHFEQLQIYTNETPDAPPMAEAESSLRSKTIFLLQLIELQQIEKERSEE